MEENRIISENNCKHSMEITIEIKILIFDLVRHVYGITFIKYAQVSYNLHQIRSESNNLHQIRSVSNNLHQVRSVSNNLHQIR